MPIPRHITEFLESHKVSFKAAKHPPAYTAQGVAHAQHISGKDVAKVVVVVAGDSKAIAVVPGHHRVNLELLGASMNEKGVRLATEEEFKNDFPDCEVGAMPPFGSLYGLKTWVDEELAEHPHITFNAGTHVDTIEISYADFDRVENPHKGKFVSGR